MSLLRVAILQYPIVWADKQSNLRLTINRVKRLIGKADIALLPEMFSTGFCSDRPDLAEPTDGATMKTLQQLADTTSIAICGSFICSEENETTLHNRGFFVKPNESPVFIDKAHLYANGGEDRFFSRGRERTVIEYKGVKIRLLLCYDVRFPVWARNQSGWDYDVLLVSANWPEVRIAYWDVLVASRAVENQCYIAATNPIGDDGNGEHYNGHSVAYDTYLHPIVKFRDNQSGTRIANFDIERLHHFRNALPLWKDIDSFTLTEA